MNQKLIPAACGVLMSCSVFAADWQPLVTNEQGTVSFDQGSVHSDGEDLIVRVLRDYRSTRLNPFDGAWYAHRSMVLVYGVSCARRQFRYIEWSLHAGNLAGGRTVWSGRASGVSYFQTEQNSGETTLVNTVCKGLSARSTEVLADADGKAGNF